MADRRKKRITVGVDIKLPYETLAFYEGVAARTGLTLSEVINVVLAIQLNRHPAVIGAQGKPTEGGK